MHFRYDFVGVNDIAFDENFSSENLTSLDSEGLFGLNHGLHAVVHVLDEVLLGAAETSLVGDVVGSVGGLGVLSVDTTDLDVVLISDLLESFLVGGELWKLDVDGSSECGTEVGWAGGDVSEVIGVGELGDLLDGGGGSGETVEDGTDVSTLLHGDDSELVLFVDPDEEGLLIVVEDSSAIWPVTVETAGGEVLITLPKLKRVN